MRNTDNVRAMRISYQLRDAPEHARAIAEISKALEESQGVTTEAAVALGVQYRQLMRWVKEYPELTKKLEAIRVKYGHAWAKDAG